MNMCVLGSFKNKNTYFKFFCCFKRYTGEKDVSVYDNLLISFRKQFYKLEIELSVPTSLEYIGQDARCLARRVTPFFVIVECFRRFTLSGSVLYYSVVIYFLLYYNGGVFVNFLRIYVEDSHSKGRVCVWCCRLCRHFKVMSFFFSIFLKMFSYYGIEFAILNN